MGQDSTYNGWTNRETWCAMLWLNNDEGMYRQMMEAQSMDDVFDIVNDSPAALQDMARDGDVTGAVNRVNWDEVWQTVLEDRAEIS